MSTIIVKAGKDGKFLFPTKNAEITNVRVVNAGIVLNKGGFEANEVSGFASLKTSTASRLKEGDAISGKVITIESLSPQFEGQEPKRAGKEGAIITHNGAPVYRSTQVTGDLNACDMLLSSDKVAVAAEEGAE